MKHRLSHIAKIIFAVCLTAGLTLTLFFGIASAGPPICQPDGRPAFVMSDFPPNREVTIIAFDQNGKETVTKGKLDDKGNGTFYFGESGVLYMKVLVGLEGVQGPITELKNVKCDAPQKPPQLTTIEVTPPSVDMQVGDQRTFTTTFKDENGKEMTVSTPTWTTSGGGTLSNCSGTTCTYTATQAGDFTITVGEGGTTIQGTATIHTTSPFQLTSIEMMPPSVNMQVGQQQLFTATGRDQNGQPYTLSNPTWTTSGGGTVSPNGATATYTATQAGDFTITAGEGGTTIQGTATIHTTNPQQLTSIEMMPPSVNMQVGQQQLFTATGRDQNGQPYTLSNPQWTTSGGGTLSPNGTTCTYTATQAGDFTITAGEGGTTIQGTATIQVEPPETSALWIIGGVLALGIAAGAGYWIWGRPKV